MNAADHTLALTVECSLCKVPAGTECVNSVDKATPRDQPHHSRAVRGARVSTAADYLQDIYDTPPNAGSAS